MSWKSVSVVSFLYFPHFFRSAHLISAYRPRCPILAVTRTAQVARQAHMYRAIIPIYYEGKLTLNVRGVQFCLFSKVLLLLVITNTIIFISMWTKYCVLLTGGNKKVIKKSSMVNGFMNTFVVQGSQGSLPLH